MAARRLLALSTVLASLTLGLTPALVATASPANAATCPCSIWAATATPGQPANPDTGAVELGVKFRSDEAGTVSGIRFYKGSGNTGTHVGNLWSTSGTRLATVTFTGETATGWQQANFSSPVSINANTTYIASYFAPNGRYASDNDAFAAAGVDKAPLHALRDGVDGPNGVYKYGAGGGFPTDTYRATNYWVDVVFETAGPDTTSPTVTTTTPASGATSVPSGTIVTATYSEAVQPTTVQLQLAGPGGAAVSGSVSYDAASRTATFTPGSPLAASTSYTANATGATDSVGNVMSPYSWSFTTAASGSGCPCTIWPDSATPAIANTPDNSAIELGVRFRASSAGYITGLRFYKGNSNTGTHVGSLWTNTGTRLSQVTFTNETGTGWQTATLPAPVAITANATYVASYFTSVGFYSTTNNAFGSAGVTRGPLTALQSGVDGPNGVYRYGSSAFPTDSYQASNYWVDVVFDTTAADTTPPSLSARTPAPGATGAPTSTTVTATFNEPVTASSVQMTLTGPSRSVNGSVSYSSSTNTATFTPTAALATSTSYTVNVSGARDAAGNVMVPASWSFSTAGPPPPPLDQGPGGPVLVVKNPATGASPFSPYLAEVLRAEGLNEFASANLPSVTASMLNGYDVVLLGATPLTSAQVTMFTNWVTNGGNLIAFRPAKNLASLLRLTSTTGTLANGYIKVDATRAPGAGITDQTIQYHGTADRYTLAGARAVATLYSNATTATTNPALTLADVGTSGGQAAAFTYDLPESIVHTRQGNPAWDGQERDGFAPIRSDDLFFGTASTSWVNLNKVAIPQADEQQRLLANLIHTMNLDRKPLPRFWYFPRETKAVVVATGDDHANGGTAGRFDKYLANSTAGCSVTDWQCLRFTSYIFPNSPLTSTQANTYVANGFEVGLHPQNGCTNFTPTSLAADYASQLSQLTQNYPGLPAPVSNRYHCLVWSDWASQPTVEGQNGIRLDVNYYYWPPSWINNRPGFMTGSGMPMRFASKTGPMIDVYQAATQMTDESGQTYPFTPNTLLDNALGPLGYYGAFVANVHTDQPTTFEDDQLLASARARNVPVITGRQLLSWLDGRNSSSYGSVQRSGNTLSFTVAVGAGANGLTGMVPTVGSGGTTLSTLTRGGGAVAFTRTTVKGVEYAMFQAQPGAYVATYGASGAPAITEAEAEEITDDSAQIAISSTSASQTEVSFGTSPTDLTEKLVDASEEDQRTITLSDLEPGETYYYEVRVRGPAKTASAPVTGKITTKPRDTGDPDVTDVGVQPLPDGTATATWRTDEESDSTLLLGERPDALAARLDGSLTQAHTVVATGLRPSTTYYYRVQSVDAAGNTATWPDADEPPAQFDSSPVGVAEQTAAQFRAGSLSDVSVSDDGQLRLLNARSGRYVSGTLDAQQMVDWDRLTYGVDLPAGASVRFSFRTGSTSEPDDTWSQWEAVGSEGEIEGSGRYIQYRVDLRSSASGETPVVRWVGITNSGTWREPPGES